MNFETLKNFFLTNYSNIDDWIMYAVTLVAALIGVIVVFRQKQFSAITPKFFYDLGDSNNRLPKSVFIEKPRSDRRRYRKNPYFHGVELPKKSDQPGEFHLSLLPVSFRNTGSVPIQNLRISIELPSSNVVRKDELQAVNSNNEGYVFDQESRLTQQAELSFSEDNYSLYNRSVAVAQGAGYVTYDVGLLRPGESAVLFEPIKLRVGNAGPVSDLLHPETGYDNVVSSSLLNQHVFDLFPVTAYFRAENHSEVCETRIVLSVNSEEKDKALEHVVKCHWFGGLPKGGYMTSPWIFERFVFRTGRRRGGFAKVCSGNFRRPKIIHPKGKIKQFSFDAPELPSIEPFFVSIPNVDVLAMPSWVQDAHTLLSWMGFQPLPRILGGPTSTGQQ